MRRPFRFFFTAADQALIDPNSISVEDTPIPIATPLKNEVPYQSLKVSFNLLSSGGPAPQIRPLFSGQVRFIPSPDAAGTIPNAPTTAPTVSLNDFLEQNITNWKSVGTLILEDTNNDARDALEARYDDLYVIPNRIWYSNIKITVEFLLGLVNDNRHGAKGDIVATGQNELIEIDNEDWPYFAVINFIRGLNPVNFAYGATPEDDDAVRFPMPETVMDNNGIHTLIISAARYQSPSDDRETRIYDASVTGFGFDPGNDDDFNNKIWNTHFNSMHPMNGSIPARHVYRTLQHDMVPDDITGTNTASSSLSHLADATFNDQNYFQLRITRIWQPWRECSAFFPDRTITLEHSTSHQQVFSMRLPSHGMVFVPEGPDINHIDHYLVNVDGDLKLVDGSVNNTWRVKGTDQPVDVVFSPGQVPHVILRRPMGDEILRDPQPERTSDCTYASLRRSLRALVNNRICGGRLLIEEGENTRNLLNEAHPDTLKLLRDRPGWPPKTDRTAINNVSDILRTILEVFFNDDAYVPIPINNPPNRTEGWVGYFIWVSATRQFDGETSILGANGQYLFPDAHIGRGGPGALVYLGLAENYHFDPPIFTLTPPLTVESSEAEYKERIVDATLTGLEPGAIIQFWSLISTYESVKSRNAYSTITNNGVLSDTEKSRLLLGHSVVFKGYTYDDNGEDTIEYIDQHGKNIIQIERDANNLRTFHKEFKIGGAIISEHQIWIAANWGE